MDISTTKPADFSARTPLNGVDELFYHRWSPRAFDSTPVEAEKLAIIFDAARWSPSCYNDQPWHFLTSTESSHEKFLSLLVEANQSWAHTAPVLGFVLADRHFGHDGSLNAHAHFDAGAAWMAMTLQARLLGLYTHGMAGVDYEGIYSAFDIDRDKTEVICGFALGYIGDPGSIPENYRDMEKPNSRKALSEIWRQVD